MGEAIPLPAPVHLIMRIQRLGPMHEYIPDSLHEAVDVLTIYNPRASLWKYRDTRRAADDILVALESANPFLRGFLLGCTRSATIWSGDNLSARKRYLGRGLHVPAVRWLASDLGDMPLSIRMRPLHLSGGEWCSRAECLAARNCRWRNVDGRYDQWRTL